MASLVTLQVLTEGERPRFITLDDNFANVESSIHYRDPGLLAIDWLYVPEHKRGRNIGTGILKATIATIHDIHPSLSTVSVPTTEHAVLHIVQKIAGNHAQYLDNDPTRVHDPLQLSLEEAKLLADERQRILDTTPPEALPRLFESGIFGRIVLADIDISNWPRAQVVA